MITTQSPNTDNYLVGKGIVMFKPEGAADFIDVGNVPEFEFTPTTETLDHFSSREGVKSKDKSIVLQKGGTIRMVMEEWTGNNLAFILLGDAVSNDVKATGTLTAAGQPADADTVTIAGKVYTFKTVLTNTDGFVLIGGTAAASLANLSAAINLGAGSGTLYAAATTLHPSVSGNGASPLVVTAKEAGISGNGIATTESSTNLSWGSATLTGGAAGNPSINIFSKNAVNGHLKFYATNEVGPRWDYDLPNVSFLPSGSINPISDEWGQLEATGQVLVSGSNFGTCTLVNLSGALAAPQNLALPYITGVMQVGKVLTAHVGTWRDAVTYAYQWQNANVDIGGATSETYTPVVGDAGDSLSVVVTATNATGNTVAESVGTPAILA